MSKQLADNQDLLAMTHVGEDPEKYMKSVTPPIFMNSLHVFDEERKKNLLFSIFFTYRNTWFTVDQFSCH